MADTHPSSPMNPMDDDDDYEPQQSVKTKIIKCKTNNQQIQMPSYNILTSNAPPPPPLPPPPPANNLNHSMDIPNEHTSLKLHIRRVCSPSSLSDTLAIHPTSNLLCQSLNEHDSSQTSQQILTTKIIPRKFFNSNDLINARTPMTLPRRLISTRRTSLVETDIYQQNSTSIYTLTKTNISDENMMKKPVGRPLSQKRKTLTEQQEKKRTKLTTRTTKSTTNTSSRFSFILRSLYRCISM